MGTNSARRNVGYGLSNALQQLAPLPIISQRDPTANDIAELGTEWINTADDSVWVITSVTAGAANWTTSPASGVGTFTSVDIDPGDLEVVSGNIIVDVGNLTLTAGDALIGGNLDVSGTATFSGDIDFSSPDAIEITSNFDGAQAIYLHADGGTSETIEIRADQGTGVASVELLSDVGGITLNAGLATADAINLEAASGGIDMDSALLMSLTSSRDNAQAILLEATAGGIDILASGASAGEDIDIVATGSSVNIESTENAALAVYLHANGGTSETIRLRSDQGTGVASIDILSDVGGITLTAGLGTADAINIVASDTAGGIDVDAGTAGFIVDTTGAISLDAAAASNFTATGAFDVTVSSTLGSVVVLGGEAAVDAIQLTSSDVAGGIDVNAGTGGITIDSTGAFSIDGAAASNVTTTGAGIDLTLSSVLGSVLVSSTENAALAIRLHADGGTSETIQIHSDQGTGVASIGLLSDVGGLTLRSTGLASADAINLEAAAGGIDMDSALQTNIASSQASATAIRLVASDVAGGFDIDSGTGGFIVDTTGAISLDAAAASNFTATGAFDVTVSSTAGSINISGGEAAADAINIDAAAGGLDVDVALQMNLTSSQAAADAVRIFASAASGGIDVDAGTGGMSFVATGGSITVTAGTGGNGTLALSSTGTGDVTIDSDDTMLLDADGVLELNSSAGAISIGNDADNQAINIGSAGVRPIQVGNASAGTTLTLLGPANVGVTLQNSVRIMTGAGSPDGAVTAPAGSLWLRTDPAGATSRIYVNTDSSTAWTNVTCAA